MILLEELKKNIERYRELQEITQALEQSAASYIVKVRDQVLKSRDFYEESWATYNLYQKIVFGTSKKKLTSSSAILLISPNQGMYGAMLWRALDELKNQYAKGKADIFIVGKKARALVPEKLFANVKYFDLPEELSLQSLNELITAISKYSNLRLIYPKYISAFEQKIDVKELIVDENLAEPTGEEIKILNRKRYILDPDQLSLEQYFSSAVIGLILFRYFIESLLAYKAAQMIAMKRAHDNASKELETAKFRYSRDHRELIDSRLRELNSSRNIIKQD